ADADAVLELLKQSGLPTDGWRQHLATAFVVRQDERIVGSAALEMYPAGALLRSVVVSPECRGTHIGHRLTRSAIELARDLEAPAIYLLTTTAERFFRRFGF